MKTKNILLSQAFLIIGMLFVACSSDEDTNQNVSNNNKKYAEYALSFNTLDISNLKKEIRCKLPLHQNIYLEISPKKKLITSYIKLKQDHLLSLWLERLLNLEIKK